MSYSNNNGNGNGSSSSNSFTKSKQLSTSISNVNASGMRQSGVFSGTQSASKRGFGPGDAKSRAVTFNGRIATPQPLLPRKIEYQSNNNGSSNHNRGLNHQKHNATNNKALANSINSIHGIQKIDEHAADMGHDHENEDVDELQKKGEGGVDSLNENTMETTYIIELTETNTITVFDIPSLIEMVPSNSENYDDETAKRVQQINQKNAHYDSVKERHVNAVDSFTSHATQTLNHPCKNQNEMTTTIALTDFGNQISSFEILDEVKKMQITSDELTISPRLGATEKNELPFVRKYVNDAVTVSLVSPGCLLDMHLVKKPPVTTKTTKAKKATGMSQVGTSNVFNDVSANGGGGMSSSMGVSSSHNFDKGNKQLTHSSNSNHAVSTMQSIGRSKMNISKAMTSSMGGLSSSVSGVDLNAHANIFTEYSFGPSPNPIGTVDLDSLSGEEMVQKTESDRILTSKSLILKLEMMERAVLQNVFAYSQQKFVSTELHDATAKRKITVYDMTRKQSQGDGIRFSLSKARQVSMSSANLLAGGHSKHEPMKRLFHFRNTKLVGDREVTTLSFNPVDTHLLAVGYGEIVMNMFETEGVNNDRQGLVLFWSTRNPRYPEKVLRTIAGVTSLAFSKSSPLTLAVGMQSGDIAIYDLSKENWQIPIEESSGMVGNHTDVVCQLRWYSKNNANVQVGDPLEDLISISTDGMILNWSLKKGFAVTPLMKLKRNSMGDGWISRLSSGLCFDFPIDDSSTYMVGTEDGSLHRCSVSYNEQVLETFTGHVGPLYRVRFSPFSATTFLTCSADWTIGLYSSTQSEPIAKFRTKDQDAAVNDIAWCPNHSTVFATALANGKIQLWDLSASKTEPDSVIDTTILGDDPHFDVSNDLDLTTNGLSSKLLTRMLNSANMTPNSRLKRELAESPVSKLVDGLKEARTTLGTKRSLTCIAFGLDTATLAVGDSAGYVSIFQVTNPPLIDKSISLEIQQAELEEVMNSFTTTTSVGANHNDK